jgi:GNAT superfamily N-acetyltransferase
MRSEALGNKGAAITSPPLSISHSLLHSDPLRTNPSSAQLLPFNSLPCEHRLVPDSQHAPLTGSLIIRPISLDDAAAVAELSAQLGYPVSTDVMSKRMEQLAGCADQAVFVASLDRRVVGWIEVIISRHLHSGSYALISGLVVSSEVRGRRIGSRLCTQAEQWARDHGQTLVRVRSQISREGAHRFYLREGYRQTKTSAAFEKNLAIP